MVPALKFGRTHLAEAPGKRVQHLDLMPANHAGTSDRYLAGFTRMLLQDVLDWIEWYPLFGSTFRAIARRGHSGLDGP